MAEATRPLGLTAWLSANPQLPAVDALRRGRVTVFEDTRILEEAANRLGALFVRAELAVIENQINDPGPAKVAMPHVPVDAAPAN